MGIQGPLTAQALGRSPYDDIFEGEGVEDFREPTQQYDHRGRPINLETKRLNREIVRCHNEVMLAAGVAEPDNATAEREMEAKIESHRRHQSYEEAIGIKLATTASYCVEAVGLFGINGLRQRILIYKRYSEIPFWHLFNQSRLDMSLRRDILPGLPSSFMISYFARLVGPLWQLDDEKQLARRCVQEVWSYVRVHLELFAALQRLGLVSNTLWLPSPLFFIPFTKHSPMPAPPPPESLHPAALLRWLGSFFISTTPFLVWVMTEKLTTDWNFQLWRSIFSRLPNTGVRIRTIPLPPPRSDTETTSVEDDDVNDTSAVAEEYVFEHDVQDETAGGNALPVEEFDSQWASGPTPGRSSRRHSVSSGQGDGWVTDEEENEATFAATLVSFDVEAADAPDPGVWSAELRPTLYADGQPVETTTPDREPVYLDTLLTQLPALVAAHTFTDACSRILMAPYEAMALRLVARTIRLQQGLSCSDIYSASLLSGMSWTFAVNYLGSQLMHLVLSGEVWAVFASLSQWFHMSEEDWKDEDRGNID